MSPDYVLFDRIDPAPLEGYHIKTAQIQGKMAQEKKANKQYIVLLTVCMFLASRTRRYL